MFHETPKSSMEQNFKASYMIKLDKTFEFHETKFHLVVVLNDEITVVFAIDRNSDSLIHVMCNTLVVMEIT